MSSSAFGSSRSTGGGSDGPGRRPPRPLLPPRPFSASCFPGGHHKAQMELAIVRRRQLDSEKEHFWSNTVNYYDSVERNTDRFNHWNSDAVVQTSLQASYKEQQLEARRSDLSRRRDRLRALLAKETAAMEEELRLLPPSSTAASTDLSSLRGAREALRRQREEEQQKEAEEKMIQHWKLNNPEFRELQFKKHRSLVQKAWEMQQQEKDMLKDAEKKAEMRRMQVEIEESVRQEYQKRSEEEKREVKMTEWKETIRKQIEELRSKKVAENGLKEEIRKELELLAKTEEVSHMKKKMEERRKNIELGHYLQRQHALKLRIRAAQVQSELEDDKKLVEEMQKISKDKPAVDKQMRELEWMKKVLTEQKEEEKRREKQMNFMFSEEAEGFWDRQDRIWNAEKVAREKLMDNVVSGWKTQIEQKINDSHEKVAKIAEERLKIEAEMERINQEIELEGKKRLEKRDIFVQDIQDQIEEKKEKLPEDGNAKDKGDELAKTNELAAKLAQWNLQSDLITSDFRRRRAKWF